MEKHKFKSISLGIAVVFWLAESALHRLFFGGTHFDFVPGELNELWMRILIVLLVIAFGSYMDMHVCSLRQKEKEKEVVNCRRGAQI